MLGYEFCQPCFAARDAVVALKWDVKHADFACPACGDCTPCPYEYNLHEHINGTLEKNDGGQRYDRGTHLRGWMGKVNGEVLARHGRTMSELEHLARHFIMIFETRAPIAGTKNVNYGFLLRNIMTIVMCIPDADIDLKRIKNRARKKKCSEVWDALYSVFVARGGKGVGRGGDYIALGRMGPPPVPAKMWYTELERRKPWVKAVRLKLNLNKP